LLVSVGGTPWTEEANPISRRSGISANDTAQEFEEVSAVKIEYLEIVTPEVDATCHALGEVRGVTFGEPVAELGNARTAVLEDGGRIGVRAPMRETEEPVVRPYVLVEDIEAAVESVEAAGAVVALPPTEIPGQGTFAIYILGGIEHGLWEL
jgi:predicted enzyme related to lactoylglutathione lyase